MYDPKHYRDQAERGRRLSRKTHDKQVSDTLKSTAKDLDEVADDLESGTVQIRHPELMPQNRRSAEPAAEQIRKKSDD